MTLMHESHLLNFVFFGHYSQSVYKFLHAVSCNSHNVHYSVAFYHVCMSIFFSLPILLSSYEHRVKGGGVTAYCMWILCACVSPGTGKQCSSCTRVGHKKGPVWALLVRLSQYERSYSCVPCLNESLCDFCTGLLAAYGSP